jgi:hypothetical protein
MPSLESRVPDRRNDQSWAATHTDVSGGKVALKALGG